MHPVVVIVLFSTATCLTNRHAVLMKVSCLVNWHFAGHIFVCRLRADFHTRVLYIIELWRFMSSFAIVNFSTTDVRYPLKSWLLSCTHIVVLQFSLPVVFGLVIKHASLILHEISRVMFESPAMETVICSNMLGML